MLAAMSPSTEPNQASARNPGAQAWIALCAVLMGGALVGWFAPSAALDWQPARWVFEPWRWWTAAFVHLSPLHLGANALGVLVVAWLGWSAGLPVRVAVAWGGAWPLTHLALAAVAPDLAHYGGLSGVLHAGVAAAGVHLVVARAPAGLEVSAARTRRRIGAAILAVLAVKLVSEAPWGPAARAVDGWDILVAPIAHTTGAVSAAVVAGLLEWRARRGVTERPVATSQAPRAR
jgi:membrane associated rhomboid family serine protease